MSQSRSRHDTPRRTPIPTRSYLFPNPIHHQSPQASNSRSHTPHMIDTNSLGSQEQGVVYGTNISTRQAIAQLQRFVQQFQEMKVGEDGPIAQRVYHRQLTQLDIVETCIFTISGQHLREFDRELYAQFIYYPAQMISCFDFVLKSMYEKYFIESESDQSRMSEKQEKRDRLMVGIHHLQSLTQLRNLSPRDINKLISFRGIVIRTSQVHPEMKRAMYRCIGCHWEQIVQLQNAKVQQPVQCGNTKCRMKNSLQIIHNLCAFTDKQFVKIQQLTELVPEGQTPASTTLILYDDNVDGMRPGDRVQIVGIYRTQPIKTQRSKPTIKSVFNTYIDLISFQIVKDQRLQQGDDIPFSDRDKHQFRQLADREDWLNVLIDSFAPSIFGHSQVKKGILAQLFGGTNNKNLQTVGRGRFRSDINICLVGDPSTAKSQLLQQVHRIAPRGIYTSGRGSSAVGLTANVRKDPQTKQFVLQSGALVLSDLGICCIDQFDKMDVNSRMILLQAMEQQTISIAKAGIVCQLNSRTAILAAANPVNSKYDPRKSVIQNINLSPALLSRFDLIYILLDIPNQENDTNLATHILDIYSNRQQPKQTRMGVYPRSFLAKYITYAKNNIHPIITEVAGKKLCQAYLQMRELGNNRKVITATPRQLQSLIRISESFARMRLSNQVSEEDVEEAIGLIKVATQQAATDPITGIIDMDIITTGKTSSSKQKIDKIKDILKQILFANAKIYLKHGKLEEIRKEAQKHMGEALEGKEVLQALRHLEADDILVVYGQNKANLTFKLTRDRQM